jgi:hypothetical protein
MSATHSVSRRFVAWRLLYPHMQLLLHRTYGSGREESKKASSSLLRNL